VEVKKEMLGLLSIIVIVPSISSILTVISNDDTPLSSSMDSIILFFSLTKYDGFLNLTVIAIQRIKRNFSQYGIFT